MSIDQEKIQETENKMKALEKEIKDYCDGLAKHHLQIRQELNEKYSDYAEKVQNLIAKSDGWNHHDKIKLIRRLSVMGLAVDGCEDFYGTINIARCNK